MSKISVEVDTYRCSYCGFEHYQLNRLLGQSGATRYICGDCFIKVYDRGLKYEVKPERNPTVVENRRPPSPANKGNVKKG